MTRELAISILKEMLKGSEGVVEIADGEGNLYKEAYEGIKFVLSDMDKVERLEKENEAIRNLKASDFAGFFEEYATLKADNAKLKQELADEIKEHEAEQKDAERDFDKLYADNAKLKEEIEQYRQVAYGERHLPDPELHQDQAYLLFRITKLTQRGKK